MNDTPITDRAERCADYGMSVPAEQCRDLERVANQLAAALKPCVDAHMRPMPYSVCINIRKALAAFESMKKGTT